MGRAVQFPDQRARCYSWTTSPSSAPLPPATARLTPVPRRPVPRSTHPTAGAALLALMVAVIGVATLTPGAPVQLELTSLTCLVCGSAGTADVVRNLLLFIPLGVAGALLGWRWPRGLAAGFLLSLAVESLQLWVIPGRDPSLSDLLTNTTGTAIGFGVAASWRYWGTPTVRGARTLAAAGAVAWAAFLAASAAGLQWDAPPLPYQMTLLPPPFAGVREYEGPVYDRSLNGRPPSDADGGAALAAAIASGRLSVGATVGPMYPPGLLRPLVAFYRPDWTSALLFGQQRRGLVLRLRTRAEAARLQGPRFVLHDVFPDLAEASTAAGRAQRITIGARVDGARVELSAERDGRHHSATRWRRLSLGWTFIMPTFPLLYRLAPLLGALWLAAPLLPLGYWTRRGLRPTAGARARLAAAAFGATVAAALLIVASAGGGLAPPSPLEWAALLAAGAAGWTLGAATSRPS